MTLFLDACAIIYQVELSNPLYRKVAALTARFHRQHPDLQVAVSRLSFLECRVKPLRDGDHGRLRLFEEFFALAGLVVVEIDAQVIDQAALLRATRGLRTPDAIQAACALSLQGSVHFVTNDPAFKRVPGLDVGLL